MEGTVKDVLPFIMPMTISWFGNSSVATVPTLLDLLYKGNLENNELKKGIFMYLLLWVRG